jgi:ceramide glucosyltransferase
MTAPIWIAAGFCSLLLLTHIVSIAIAAIRFRAGRADVPRFARGPGISLIRPLCGLENFIEDTLRSGFELDYPNYELLFCVADRADPVIPLVEQLMREHPQVPARLLLGDERLSDNPKLNNMLKGERVAAHGWLLMADSNVLMPRDYIQRALSAWRTDTGVVCSPPAGARPLGVWAELEVAFFNSYQARWQYVADTIGTGFAQGKTMLWRRADLQRAGGLEALAAEIAEDAAATKAVRAMGLRVRLVAPPFAQPLGRRGPAEVWRRQLRWAQLRRASFPLLFAGEIFAGVLPPLAAAVYAAAAAGTSPLAVACPLLLLWYGAEALLVRAARWPLTLTSPLAWLVRDLLLPPLWIEAWIAKDFVWRGNAMRSREPARVSKTARELLARFTAG